MYVDKYFYSLIFSNFNYILHDDDDDIYDDNNNINVDEIYFVLSLVFILGVRLVYIVLFYFS